MSPHPQSMHLWKSLEPFRAARLQTLCSRLTSTRRLELSLGLGAAGAQARAGQRRDHRRQRERSLLNTNS